MTIGELAGRRVVLVPMRLEEADLLATWLRRPDAAWTRREVLERWPPVFFDDAYPQKGRVFRIDLGGQAVGAVVHGATWGEPRSVLLELVLAPAGPVEAGRDAIEALLSYVFEAIAVRTAWTEVDPADAAALAPFEAAGFQRAGTADTGRLKLRLDRPRRNAARAKPK